MKRNPFGIETKVGVGAGTVAVLTLVFDLAGYYHWFTPPPPYLTGFIVAAVSAVAAWVAPHTPRPGTLTGDLTAEFYTKPPVVTQLPAAPKETTP